jgi:hypothetical protein
MQFLRKAALTAAASLLTLSLFSFGLGWSLYQVFGTPAALKKDLKASGIYDNAAVDVLSQHQDDTGSSVTRIRTDNPEVQRIVAQSIPPSFVQAQTEKVIDSVYGWLNGTQPSLQFNVDLSGPKNDLANNIGNYVQQRLGSLPTCTPDTIPTGDVNVFTVQCLPPDFDQTAAAAQARDQILNGGFLTKTDLTQNTSTENGKSVAQELQDSRANYRSARRTLMITGIVAIVMAVAVVLLAATWRVGIRKVAIVLITVGAVSGILAWLSSFVAQAAAHKIAESQTSSTSLADSVAKLTKMLVSDVHTHWSIYAATLIILGVLALVAIWLARPKSAVALRLKKQGSGAPNTMLAGAAVQKGGRHLVSTDRQTQTEHAEHVARMNEQPRLTVDGMPANDQPERGPHGK